MVQALNPIPKWLFSLIHPRTSDPPALPSDCWACVTTLNSGLYRDPSFGLKVSILLDLLDKLLYPFVLQKKVELLEKQVNWVRSVLCVCRFPL